MDLLQQAVGAASALVWGVPMLALLLGTGAYLTVLLRGLQLRQLGHSLWLALVKRTEPGAEGDIPHFQALMTALAATVGVGNIAGVATAIAAGGPGALFWMWVTGLVGMATKYAEAVLGVRYREVDARGRMTGGPMYYLRNGVGGRLGAGLGFAFALCAAFAAFGIGNMVQSNSVADALQSAFDVPPIASGAAIALFAGLVILGGIRWIGRVTSFFVPIMITFYLLSGLLVLALHWRAVPGALEFVVADAFRPSAAAGGFLGASLRAGIRWGVARGVFSNESGLGTGGIAAAAAQTREPVRQALVSMTQTFIDTLVVCSVTGLVIVVTGAWTQVDPITGSAYTGAPLTAAAFQSGLPGAWGGNIVALGLVFFAFSTILGWAYYGERAIEYLFGERAIVPYRIVFIAASFFGAVVLQLAEQQTRGFQLVWDFSDTMNGAMAIPNLIGLLLLSGVVARETRGYFARHPTRREEP
ncbi:MAG: sodium:alanine symporter family protein [Deltaproteobacteria bacterium]|nr:MAG: sodium:alanine symporter family protein [Deltaproteobacteria bacterium]